MVTASHVAPFDCQQAAKTDPFGYGVSYASAVIYPPREREPKRLPITAQARVH